MNTFRDPSLLDLTLTPDRGPGQAPASPLISPRVVVGWELLHGARERDN